MARNVLTPLDPLPLNSGLSVSFTHTAAQGVFTDLPLTLVLDITARDKTVTRATITDADAELSNDDLTVTLTKESDWVADNVVAGRVKGYFFVNGIYDSGIQFETYEPDGGDIDL